MTIESASRTATFNTAARHSRIVHALKIGLPVCALLMAAGFVWQSWHSTPSSVEVTADTSALTQGKLVMASPQLQGFTSENRPYSMRALRAVQDVTNEALIELQQVAAVLPLDELRTASITTTKGVFDQTQNKLTVNSQIDITTSDGAVVTLGSAVVDIGAGRMTTDKPVQITYKSASIASGEMSVEQNGKIIVFEKNVRVNIVPPPKEPPANEQASQ